MKRTSLLLVALIVMVAAASPVFAQGPDLTNARFHRIACKALFDRDSGELTYVSDWRRPVHGQTTAQYLLSFPPLTIGFLKEVGLTQTQDRGVQVFTATPVSMRVSLLDARNHVLLEGPCSFAVVSHASFQTQGK